MKRIHPLACLLAVAAAVGAATVSAATAPHTSRQQEIVRQGAEVMPFDLQRTRHFFDDTSTGGVESITANDKKDQRQISLIREHLQHEQSRFAEGNFSDPARIHGVDMPGLATLASAAPNLKVAYRSIAGGASLTFASRDRQVVQAIHDWFAAQRTDHAAHEHMHPMHD